MSSKSRFGVGTRFGVLKKGRKRHSVKITDGAPSPSPWVSKGEGRGKRMKVPLRHRSRGKPRRGKVGCLPDGAYERKVEQGGSVLVDTGE